MVEIRSKARGWRLAAAAVVALGLSLPAGSPTWADGAGSELSLSPAAQILAQKISAATTKEEIIALLVASRLSKAEVQAAITPAISALRAAPPVDYPVTGVDPDELVLINEIEGLMYTEPESPRIGELSRAVTAIQAKKLAAYQKYQAGAALLTFLEKVDGQLEGNTDARSSVVTFVDNTKKEDGGKTNSQATGAISNPATQTLAQGATTTIYVG
ncbi:hypothetical protein [Phenylobacterium conjunctum]|uniref:Peptidylprolyl isomerase n=1 Tax=Phenylobacterium conjunctum TaxID=1298959 RepID=A0ABW3T4W5_9CAUL